MNRHSWLKWGAIAIAPLVTFLLLVSLAVPAQAEGGFAISGSFYRQQFELPQGSTLKSPDVYVVVFNNSDSDLGVRLTSETPLGVKLILSEDDFQLKAGEQRKVEIGVEVSSEAVPGEYEISVTAEPYKKAATGIQIMGAARQEAKLTIVGEAASVEVTAVNPDGEPTVAMVKLVKQVGSQTFDFGYSETGSLKVRVSPGDYSASAYIAGKKLAEQSFSVAANEDKKIALEVRTIYFEGFGIVPNYDTKTHELAFAQVVYTINNLYQPFPEAKVVLKVNQDGAPLDEVTLATLSPLEKGRLGLNYNYVPGGGWEKAAYAFKLDLNIGGETYTSSQEETLEVSTIPTHGSSNINWLLIGGIAGGVLLVVIIVLLVRRRSYY